MGLDLKQQMQKAVESVGPNVIEPVGKTTVGFTGAAAAMSINDIAGLVVAIMTAVYMAFQIEAAYARRKKRRESERKD